MRNLATVRYVDSISPIQNADAIEIATVDGWKIVVKKGEFLAGQLAVYCEIDSWIPNSLAPFLSKGKEPRVFEGIPGERLRTIKLRGQLSQGLLLPLTFKAEVGTDVSELLGVLKYEAPIPAQLSGLVKGNFPIRIPKTAQERVQNLGATLYNFQGSFEVTEKLEGSSMTAYVIEGEFGVCSRNLELKPDVNNSFWKAAYDYTLEEKLCSLNKNIAIQGELVGPGIQGNIYNLSSLKFFVFDIFNIDKGEFYSPLDRRNLVFSLGIEHVPVVDFSYLNTGKIEDFLKFAEGPSILNPKQLREGLVFKSFDSFDSSANLSFKAISNEYLLNQR
jgi:RNA ligase (TIGR02306 family)